MDALTEICNRIWRTGEWPTPWTQSLIITLPKQGILGCLRSNLSWFNWWVSFAPEIQCCYFSESSCLFYLRFNFDFYVSKIMHL